MRLDRSGTNSTSGAKRLGTLCGVSIAALTLAATGALAQANIEGRSSPGSRPLDTPDYLAPEPQIAAPPMPQTQPGGSITAKGPVFKIQKIEVAVRGGAPKIRTLTIKQGGEARTVDAATAIAEIVKPFEDKGRSAGLAVEDIVDLRDKITILYVDSGYINSGALIADQDVTDGILQVEIVEGTLGETTVNSVGKPHLFRLRGTYVQRRMALPPGEPLQKEALQRKFRRLVSDPNIKRIDARLVPGKAPGVADLAIDIEETKPYALSLSAANDRSPSVGGNRVFVDGELRNVIGYGDLWTAEIGKTEGLLDGQFTFSMPITPDDLKASLSLSGSDAKVIEEPLNVLDIISKSWTIEGGLSQPVFDWYGAAATVQGTLGASIAYKYSESDLAGLPFSFSPGAVNGKTEITLARVSSDWIFKGTTQALALRAAVTQGLDALTPTVITPVTPHDDFRSAMLQANYIKRLPKWGHQFSAQLNSQITGDSQFATEKFTFGGLDSVRGYRKNEGLADSGISGSVQYSVPLSTLSFIPYDGAGALIRALTVSAFVDGAKGWDANGAGPGVDELYSAGIDLDWRPIERLSVNLNWGAQLSDVPSHTDEGPQDWGLGFRISLRAF